MLYNRSVGIVLIFCIAGTTSAAGPTTKAGLLNLTNISQNCSPTECKVSQRIKSMTTHVFDITPSEEAALQSDAVISVTGGLSFSFPLASDPNFQNGDKSAKFKEVTPLMAPAKGSAIVSYSAKWGNGKLTVRGLQSVNVKIETPAAPLFPEINKAVPTQTVTTTLANGGGTFATVGAPVIVSIKQNQTVQVRPDGGASTKMQMTVKGNKLAP